MILGKESCIQPVNRKAVNCRLKTGLNKCLEGEEKWKGNTFERPVDSSKHSHKSVSSRTSFLELNQWNSTLTKHLNHTMYNSLHLAWEWECVRTHKWFRQACTTCSLGVVRFVIRGAWFERRNSRAISCRVGWKVKRLNRYKTLTYNVTTWFRGWNAMKLWLYGTVSFEGHCAMGL